MAAAGAPATLITSVQRALRLLEAASRSTSGASAKQLARAVGLPIGTTYHLLRTLSFEGYVRRLANGSYIVGDEVAKLLDQGELQAIVQRSRAALAALRDTARAPAYLAFFEHEEIVIKDIQDSPNTPRIDLWVGFREGGHATALGKCILAFLEPEDRRDYLARHPLHRLTARTIISNEALQSSLDRVRWAGFAVEDEEYLPGTACVAAPIVAGGRTGAVGLSFPRRRLSELADLVPRLKQTAEQIARTSATAER